MRHFLPGALLASLLLAACSSEPAVPLQITTLDPDAAKLEADSILATASVQLADGLSLSLWASERLMADPIALAFDNRGGAYITRTHRIEHSEFDIRGYREWMIESISWQSPEDRRTFLHRELAPERSAENSWFPDLNGDGSHDWRDLTVEQEEIYRIEDTSGDGVADRSQRYVAGFNTEISDLAGAVMPFRDDVYLGVAPDLWRLTDTSGDGQADEMTSISHGYAVHIGFGAHGMSGLTVGPDGRIYWSIGDIGLNVTGPDGKAWAYPNQGAILRSEPDGSGFEVFAAGLRNTHEFVFDAFGNLITVDNDGDHPGEHERLVHLIEGSDSGWRTNWQFGKYIDPDNNAYKVWMDESLYKPRFEGQAAYILPPLAAYHSGPAGMVYNPGTGLGEAWKDRFFVAEFTGSPARSRIFAFSLNPRGASFELDQDTEVSRGILTSGLDFGPDGALYAADWIDGWGPKDAGRIWKIDTNSPHPLRDETRQLLLEDFEEMDEERLAGLLGHADMRVRLEAQFALAAAGNAGFETLRIAANDADALQSRVHGIWGIGQMARANAAYADALVSLLGDDEAEIRAQAAKTLGDVRHAAAAEALRPLLADASPRVQLYAAEALGRLADTAAVPGLLAMLEANNDVDAHLRHAGVIALARIGEAAPLVALRDHPSRALRIAAVVALRRLRHDGVATFLDDADLYIVTEAARAINDDGGIEAALPALAALLDESRFTEEPLLRRIINANSRVGGPEATARLAAFANRPDAPEALRVEALAALGVWATPSVVDRVDGLYHGPAPRDAAPAREALASISSPLLQQGPVAVAIATAEAVSRLQDESALPALHERLRGAPAPELRIAALQALNALGDDGLANAIQRALSDRAETVRMTALGLIPGASLPGASVAEMLYAVLDRAPIPEQQAALRALGLVPSDHARDVLLRLFARLKSGDWRPELKLDLLEAAESHGADTLGALVAGYYASRASAEPRIAFEDALLGGDATQGQRVVQRHEAAQCMRCHAIEGQGGDIGPDLSRIASTLQREQILEALVAPGNRIAPGYGLVALTLDDGRVVRGTVREEDEATVRLIDADGTVHEVPTARIQTRETGASAMPAMGLMMSRRELRDVVSYLATLR
ncbi:MAG: HEAT repeat domain-containing protein [Rhodothermales bacterium]|nr:HEAT repeat domain-containing protein [Rhodothermales bacterium]